MSIVSGSEIQGLEDDLKDFSDNGYDTETMANTSPSHKRQKLMRQSSARAHEHISKFYSSTSASISNIQWDVPNTEFSPQQLYTQPSQSPHPSLNTSTTSKGQGALET